jgi:hypothetical protein
MFDLTAEKPIRLAEAAQIAGTGRGGRPIHISTILRWILSGVRSPSGIKIRLDGVRLGHHWCTSREAMQRFAERLTPAPTSDPGPAPRTAGKRQRDSERAAAQLAEIGI